MLNKFDIKIKDLIAVSHAKRDETGIPMYRDKQV
jgi:hypothetical protein